MLFSVVTFQDGLTTMSHKGGTIELIVGCMFVGKTKKLIECHQKYTAKGKAVLVVSYRKDQRYGSSGLRTHCGQHLASVSGESLDETKIQELAADAEVILIDEAQFFDALEKNCKKWAYDGKIVVCAALDMDYTGKNFETIAQLPADYITKLTGTCVYCQEPSTFTHRTSDETALEVIGGAEKYQPVCRQCHANQ